MTQPTATELRNTANAIARILNQHWDIANAEAKLGNDSLCTKALDLMDTWVRNASDQGFRISRTRRGKGNAYWKVLPPLRGRKHGQVG